MKGAFKIIFGFTLIMMIAIIGVYVYIGSKVVEVIENPNETGKSIGKYVKAFEDGIEEGGNISTYDTINKN